MTGSSYKHLRESARRSFRNLYPPRGVWEANRLPHFHESLPFIVLWSQKAASTAVLRWFFEKIGLLDEAIGRHRFVHHYEIDVFKRRAGYAEDVRSAARNDTIDAVKFVRDPAARAFSGYLFLNRPLLFAPTDDPAFYWRMHVLRFVHGKDVLPDAVFSFNDYLTWLVEGSPHNLDGHFAPQLTRMEKRLAGGLHIHKIESLTDAFRAIETRYRLSPTPYEKLVEVVASTHHIKKHEAAGTLDLILNEGVPNPAKKKIKFPAFSSEIMRGYPSTAELIKTFFAEDYRTYDYFF